MVTMFTYDHKFVYFICSYIEKVYCMFKINDSNITLRYTSKLGVHQLGKILPKNSSPAFYSNGHESPSNR